MGINELAQVCQILYYIALSLTGPLALFGFLSAKRKEQQQREDGTYQSLDEKYLEYQKLCLQHPELDVFDYPHTNARELTNLEKKQELIMFTILVSLFERAFIMYRDHTESVRKKQWSGWETYIEEFGKRPNFREAWKTIGEMFDTDFQQYVQSKFKQ
jgi:hypothetical protein